MEHMATTRRVLSVFISIIVGGCCDLFGQVDGSCGNTESMVKSCSVLLQSVSNRAHFGRSRREDGSTHSGEVPSSKDQLVRSPSAELDNFGLRAALTSISSSSFTNSTISRLPRWRIPGMSFMVIAFLTLLFGIAIVALWSLQRHSQKTGNMETTCKTSDGRPLPAELFAQSKSDARCYSRSSLTVPHASQATSRSTLSSAHDSKFDGKYSGKGKGYSLPGDGADSASSGEECDPEDLQFCPDLIVPKLSECVVALPVNRSRSSFSVCDMSGQTVLHVHTSVGGTKNLWTSTIATVKRDILAVCRETRSAGDSIVFELLRAGTKCWGKLVYRAEDERYLLTPTHGGVVWHFWGNFDTYSINITEETNRLFATTELGSVEYDPAGTYCRLRVAPETDVGLALCGILCIGQHMASQQKQSKV